MPVAFLDLAHQCAPRIATETLAAVISIESGFHPFAIRINSDHPLADQPRTRAEAIETATLLIAEGHDVDLGLAGINSSNLGRLGLSVSDAFDFCLNLKASASLLDGYYRAALQTGATQAQAETVMLRSYYGHGDALVGEMVGYDSQVLAKRDRLAERLATIEIVEENPTEPPALVRAEEPVAASTTGTVSEQTPQRPQVSIPQWDVFKSGRRSSALVFSNEQKE
ncbi:lytic transglycosylase domain-containing protein [Mesorhizobium sp. KR2-14]|uniref:lytic transglycosylase domain-containing protein n=1 Tax=Mesorhizobium sp. KR2-14 TaxID=3156610 RepID=UPI0032B4E705